MKKYFVKYSYKLIYGPNKTVSEKYVRTGFFNTDDIESGWIRFTSFNKTMKECTLLDITPL